MSNLYKVELRCYISESTTIENIYDSIDEDLSAIINNIDYHVFKPSELITNNTDKNHGNDINTDYVIIIIFKALSKSNAEYITDTIVNTVNEYVSDYTIVGPKEIVESIRINHQ